MISIDKILIGLAFVSLLLIFLVKFAWVNTPETWEYGAELGDVVFNLSVGYLTSYFFYILVVWIPEQKTKKKMRKNLEPTLNRVLTRISNPLDFISKGHLFLTEVDSEVFKDKIIDANFQDSVKDMITGLFTEYNTYFDVLYDDKKELVNDIDQIMSLSVFLDSDLVLILDDIKHSEWHWLLDFFYNFKDEEGFKKNSHSLKDSDKFMYEYYQYYFVLVEYMEKNKIDVRRGGKKKNR